MSPSLNAAQCYPLHRLYPSLGGCSISYNDGTALLRPIFGDCNSGGLTAGVIAAFSYPNKYEDQKMTNDQTQVFAKWLDPEIRDRVAALWSDIVQSGEFNVSAAHLSTEYTRRYNAQKEKDLDVGPKTCARIMQDLLKKADLTIMHADVSSVPRNNFDLEKRLKERWPEVEKFSVVDMPKAISSDLYRRYETLNEFAVREIYSRISAQLSTRSTEVLRIGVGSGFTVFDIIRRLTQIELGAVVTPPEIYSLTGGIFPKSHHLNFEKIDLERIWLEDKVFDADQSCDLLGTYFIGAKTHRIGGAIVNRAKQENQSSKKNWLHSAEDFLESCKKSAEYDTERMESGMRDLIPQINICGCGAFTDDHKLFRIACGELGEDDGVCHEIVELKDTLFKLNRIVGMIRDRSLDRYGEKFEPLFDVCNRLYVVQPSYKKIKSDPVIQMMIWDAQVIVDTEINPILDTVRKTFLRFAKHNILVTNGVNRADLLKNLLHRGLIKFDLICIDGELARKLF